MGYSQAISGLNAASKELDVIGNNIANQATVGFKAASVSFADMFAGSQNGMGVQVAGITQDFNDGTLTTTNRSLDLAISQNGFFRMQDSNGAIFHARNGQFKLDANRNIVNMQGMHLTGYAASGTPPTIQQGANPVALTIPQGMLSAKATTASNMVANLDSTHAIINNGATPFNADDPRTYSFVNNLTTFDSLGNRHDINVFFVKRTNHAVAGNTWDVYTRDSSVPGGVAAARQGTMTFNNTGILTGTQDGGGAASAVPFTLNVPMDPLNGAPAQNFTLNLAGSMQQNVGGDSIVSQNQTGYAAGEFTGFQINDDGTLVGTYSNQQTQLLGQVVLTKFSNPGGLSSQGGNVWQETAASGNPFIGIAGSGGFGSLTSGALESSNVDMSSSLVGLVTAQRNFQANAQTTKIQGQLSQTLINMI